MPKKLVMKKKTKKKLMKWLLMGSIAFVGAAIVVPFVTVKPDTPKLLLDTHKFFTTVKDNVSENGAFIAIGLGAMFGGTALLRKIK